MIFVIWLNFEEVEDVCWIFFGDLICEVVIMLEVFMFWFWIYF